MAKGQFPLRRAGPRRSTFAYRVRPCPHTERRATAAWGAKVNGKIVPLHYEPWRVPGRHLRGAPPATSHERGPGVARPGCRLAQDRPARRVQDPPPVQAASQPQDSERSGPPTSSQENLQARPPCRRRRWPARGRLARRRDSAEKFGFRKGRRVLTSRAPAQGQIRPR